MGPANLTAPACRSRARGGGLFLDGYVIGVCNAADPRTTKGSTPPWNRFTPNWTDRSFRSLSAERGPGDGMLVAVKTPKMPKQMRGRRTQLTEAPLQPAGRRLRRPGNVDAGERDALSGSAARAEGAEVICVVRSSVECPQRDHRTETSNDVPEATHAEPTRRPPTRRHASRRCYAVGLPQARATGHHAPADTLPASHAEASGDRIAC